MIFMIKNNTGRHHQCHQISAETLLPFIAEISHICDIYRRFCTQINGITQFFDTYFSPWRMEKCTISLNPMWSKFLGVWELERLESTINPIYVHFLYVTEILCTNSKLRSNKIALNDLLVRFHFIYIFSFAASRNGTLFRLLVLRGSSTYYASCYFVLLVAIRQNDYHKMNDPTA